MEQVLVDLARRFPLLTTLVEPRPGGKRRIAVGRLETGADGSLPLPLSLGTEAVQQHAFVTAFLVRWGEAVGSGNGRRGRGVK
jgi:hypothetical protein